jgi:multidrug efflux system membrane fusion protein
LDQYQALYRQALANLNLAEANLEAAKLNLNWTTVRSPIDGQVSRYYLTSGNLVNQDVTQLTTVVSLDPMYVYFDMDEPTLLRIKKAIKEGAITPRKGETIPAVGAGTLGMLGAPSAATPLQASSGLYPGRTEPNAPVLIALTGEDFNPDDRNRQGTINFIDNQVNPGTGSISVRGVFRNPKLPDGAYLLVPGMFVRVRLPIGQTHSALLVIDRAVTSEQGLKYVYVLDEANKVVARRVTVGALQSDGLRVISSGVNKDDRVLVGGLQQVRPGMTVQFESVSMPSLQEAATPTGAQPKTKTKQTKKK